MRRILLKPRSSLTAERIHSDTLFGAICWGYRHLYGEESLVSLLERFDSGRSPFILSSCFPWVRHNGGNTYFFPKPHNLWAGKEMDKEYRFKLNKLKYLPEELFRALTEGKLKFNELKPKPDEIGKKKETLIEAGKEYVIKNKTAFPREILEDRKIERFFKKGEVPGNAVNRLSISTEENLFFREEYFFSKNSGLFFLIHGEEKELARIKSSLKFLEDRGIGGKISAGKNQFNIREKGSVREFENPREAFVTLSLYHPAPEELSSFGENNAWYEPLVRKGKLEYSFTQAKNLWKDKVLMFSEGSVFPASWSRQHYGTCPIVKDDPFTVRQYGVAFPVGIKGAE